MEQKHLIFVYGSLRQGHGNHHLLEGASCYGTGQTLSNCAMYVVSGYPYVTSSEQRYPIIGELYAVDVAMLEKLDKMEGHPRYYVRRETTVVVAGQEYTCWMYFRDPDGTLLHTGDFNELAGMVGH